MRSAETGEGFSAARSKVQQLRAESDTRIRELLNEEQYKAYKETDGPRRGARASPGSGPGPGPWIRRAARGREWADGIPMFRTRLPSGRTRLGGGSGLRGGLMVDWRTSVRDAFSVGMTPAFTAQRAPDADGGDLGARDAHVCASSTRAPISSCARCARAGLRAGDAVALHVQQPARVRRGLRGGHARRPARDLPQLAPAARRDRVHRRRTARRARSSPRIAAPRAPRDAAAQLRPRASRASRSAPIAGFDDYDGRARCRAQRRHRRPELRQRDALHVGHDRAPQGRAPARGRADRSRARSRACRWSAANRSRSARARSITRRRSPTTWSGRCIAARPWC